VKNHVYNVTVGIALGSAVGSTDVGGLIEGNYVDTVVGTA